MSGTIWETHRGQEVLWRVLVVEFVSPCRHELRHGLIDGQCRTGEYRVGADRAEGHSRAGIRTQWVLGGDNRCRRRGYTERCRDHALVVRRGDRIALQFAERDEQPPFVVVRAIDDRNAVEVAGGEGGLQRLGQHLTVDVRRVATRVLIGQDGRYWQAAQAGSGLVRASRLRRERLARCLGAGERCLREVVGPALDDRPGEQSPGCGEATCDSVDSPPADSPKMVTFRGSPPKRAILRCTQRSAACWSIRP